MGRKKIVAKTKPSKLNNGESREIKTLKPREGSDERRDSSVPRGQISW